MVVVVVWQLQYGWFLKFHWFTRQNGYPVRACERGLVFTPGSSVISFLAQAVRLHHVGVGELVNWVRLSSCIVIRPVPAQHMSRVGSPLSLLHWYFPVCLSCSVKNYEL